MYLKKKINSKYRCVCEQKPNSKPVRDTYYMYRLLHVQDAPCDMIPMRAYRPMSSCLLHRDMGWPAFAYADRLTGNCLVTMTPLTHYSNNSY